MTQAELNRKTYLQAPTLEQVLAFVAKCRVSISRFEKFFGMPYGTIRQMKYDHSRQLPAKFWHIIYQDIIPTYGAAATPKTVTRIVTKKKSQPSPKPAPAPISDALAAKLSKFRRNGQNDL